MPPSLSSSQTLRALAMGAALWLFAALLLRVLGPMGVLDGMARAWLFLAIVPGTVPFVFLFRQVVGLRPGQLFTGFGLGTAMATVLDGLALSWAPWLYGAELSLIAGSGATILWGAGVGLFLAHAIDRRRGQGASP